LEVNATNPSHQEEEFHPKMLLGHVMHKRFFERVNQFTYKIYYLILPLSVLKNPPRSKYLKFEKFGLMGFYNKDHGARDGSNLEAWARKLLDKYELSYADGEIMLISMPRILGYVFNPISFWYCYDKQQKLRIIICEVNNTFGETHSYICVPDNKVEITRDVVLKGDKLFHVSPFMQRDGQYEFRFNDITDKLALWIDYLDGAGNKKLATSLSGDIVPINTMFDKIIFSQLVKKLDMLKIGRLKLTDPDGKIYEFEGAVKGCDTDLTLHDWRVIGSLASKGDIGFAEDYAKGRWETSDLTGLLTLSIQNRSLLDPFFSADKLRNFFYQLSYLFKKTSLEGSKKNIHAHYDLGNDFYTLWLDKTMTYSSALFDGGNEDMAKAQTRKYDRIIDRLGSKSGSVLEIGCGWGGFADQALNRSKDYEIKGITLSQEQHKYAQERLNGEADIVIEDYRHQTGKYDHIVSIEMFEAVGEQYWPTYFSKVKSLLNDKGRAVIQTITIEDKSFERYKNDTDFLRTYIFPGGLLPSPSKFDEQVKKAGMIPARSFEFGQDYAKTLIMWLDKFDGVYDKVKAMGYDDKFVKLWRFYLAGCAAAFQNLPLAFSDIEIHKDIAYGDKELQKLDIYIPPQKDAQKKQPVIVFFYGGRWTDGSKDMYGFVAHSFAQKGYITIIPDYQKYPDVKYPSFVEEGAQTVTWLQKNLKQYAPNAKDKVILSGHSSGAHTAAMLTANESYLKKAGSSIDYIDKFFGLAAPYDFIPEAQDLKEIFGPPEKYPALQVTNFIDGNEPPMLILWGEDDTAVIARNHILLTKMMDKKGAPYKLITYPNVDHVGLISALSWVVDRDNLVLNDITNFLEKGIEE